MQAILRKSRWLRPVNKEECKKSNEWLTVDVYVLESVEDGLHHFLSDVLEPVILQVDGLQGVQVVEQIGRQNPDAATGPRPAGCSVALALPFNLSFSLSLKESLLFYPFLQVIAATSPHPAITLTSLSLLHGQTIFFANNIHRNGLLSTNHHLRNTSPLKAGFPKTRPADFVPRYLWSDQDIFESGEDIFEYDPAN